MKTSSHFSSKNSALVLGTVLTASTLFAGITLAQQWLSIPTDLTNAVITIQRIILSDSGTNPSISNSGSTIELNGANGNIETRQAVILWVPQWGNLTIGWGLQFTRSDYHCTATECILKVDNAGVVTITDQFSGASTDDNIFKRTSGVGQEKNIYLSKEDGSESSVGNNLSTQSYLRVGATGTPTITPEKADTAMVVAGTIESRWGLLVRKDNSTVLGNQGTNLNTRLDANYTELELGVQEQKINFKAWYKFGNRFESPAIIFSSQSDTKPVAIGINTPSGMGPNAALHVDGDGSFLVGAWGTCSNGTTAESPTRSCSSFTDCTNPSFTICKFEDTTASMYVNGLDGKTWLHTRSPQKTLDVNGNAAITDFLTVGHPSAFDPGTDKLAINGNTRANAYYYNSDRRYKSDIVALKSPLENLLKISGYHYYSKLEKKDTLGVIAQEVEAVYPELVQTDAEGYKSVQYGNLVAPIIEAIRELATKIDNLFTLYVSQQAKIDTLEARLLKLEAQLK